MYTRLSARSVRTTASGASFFTFAATGRLLRAATAAAAGSAAGVTRAIAGATLLRNAPPDTGSVSCEEVR